MKQLITDGYRRLNAELHERRKNYGGKGDPWAERVYGYMSEVSATSYMDYGCGKGQLLAAIRERVGNIPCIGYDPVTAPMSAEELEATKVDFLTCNDVLEHVEPKLLDNVLENIAGRINKRGLLVISQRKANKTLADGRNAHLIIEKTDWWVERLSPHFWQIVEVEPIYPKRIGVELAVLVRPRTEETPRSTTQNVRLIKR